MKKIFNEVSDIIGEDIVKTLEDSDISIIGVDKYYDGREFVELEYCTNAGEDYIFDIAADDRDSFLDSFKEHVENFDVNEHVNLFASGAGTNGIPDIEELVDDAKEIKEFLTELCEKLEAISDGREEEITQDNNEAVPYLTGAELVENLIDELSRTQDLLSAIRSEISEEYSDTAAELLEDINTDLDRYFEVSDSISASVEDVKITKSSEASKVKEEKKTSKPKKVDIDRD